MQLSRCGVSFNYHGDILFYSFPWSRKPSSNLGFSTVYYSALYNYGFNSFREYWQHVGIISETSHRKGKVEGTDIQSLIKFWITAKFPSEIVVVLWNIDYLAKPKEFWQNMPKGVFQVMQDDVVIFKCKDLNKASDIRYSIERDNLGDCMMFNCGQYIEKDQIK